VSTGSHGHLLRLCLLEQQAISQSLYESVRSSCTTWKKTLRVINVLIYRRARVLHYGAGVRRLRPRARVHVPVTVPVGGSNRVVLLADRIFTQQEQGIGERGECGGCTHWRSAAGWARDRRGPAIRAPSWIGRRTGGRRRIRLPWHRIRLPAAEKGKRATRWGGKGGARREGTEGPSCPPGTRRKGTSQCRDKLELTARSVDFTLPVHRSRRNMVGPDNRCICARAPKRPSRGLPSLDLENQTWIYTSFKLAACMMSNAEVMEAARQYRWRLNVFLCVRMSRTMIIKWSGVKYIVDNFALEATLTARSRQSYVQKGTFQLLSESRACTCRKTGARIYERVNSLFTCILLALRPNLATCIVT
jgi:hypothetical protein